MIWRVLRQKGSLSIGLELADTLTTRSGGSHDSFDST
jgi:hypothetical protein